MGRLIDLVGKRFGRLVVVESTGKDKYRNYRWLCRCDCGKKIIVLGDSLKNGCTKSCGCLRKDLISSRSTTHGQSRKDGKHFSTYLVWKAMIQRCTNPKNKQWKNYGGRGITVCERWRKFENFLKDMGKCSPGLTLERKNNKKGYNKENCKWTTNAEQQRNKRNNLYVLYEGKNRLFIEVCEKYTTPYSVVYKRYYNHGWTLEVALITPVRQRRKK